MILLRFARFWRGYNPGETAGFPPEVAEPLVMAGFAEPVAPPQAEAPVSAPVAAPAPRRRRAAP